MAYYRGTPEAGRSLAVESLRLWEALGYQQGVAWALYVRGSIDVSLGDRDSGRRGFVRSLALATELKFVWGVPARSKGSRVSRSWPGSDGHRAHPGPRGAA
jgi:hypothetical protein